MKQGKLIIGMILLALLQLVACRENDVDTSPSKTMTVLEPGKIIVSSDTTTRKGDPIRLTLINSSFSNLQWKISPEPGTGVINVDTIANIFFPKSGRYTVTVRDSISKDSVSLSLGVDITDNRTDTTAYQNLDLNDVISITPVQGNSSGVLAVAETKNTYRCNNNYLLYGFNNVNDTFSFDFRGVSSYIYCMTGGAKSKAQIFIGSYPSVLEEGKAYNFEMYFNRKTYKGSFVKNGEKYQFTWPYTDGVIFTKKTL